MQCNAGEERVEQHAGWQGGPHLHAQAADRLAIKTNGLAIEPEALLSEINFVAPEKDNDDHTEC